MGRRKKRLDELERALFSARRESGSIRVSEGWREAVMGDIHRIGPLAPEKRDSLAPFAAVAWRFSAVAGLAAVVLLVYNLIHGFVDYGELVTMFFRDPSAFII
jgi:hypothetical protein